MTMTLPIVTIVKPSMMMTMNPTPTNHEKAKAMEKENSLVCRAKKTTSPNHLGGMCRRDLRCKSTNTMPMAAHKNYYQSQRPTQGQEAQATMGVGRTNSWKHTTWLTRRRQVNVQHHT